MSPLARSTSKRKQRVVKSDLATLSVSLSSGSEAEDRDTAQEEDDEDVETLREQLSTLTDSLAALTEQKANMEASFQADKKKMIVSRTRFLIYVCMYVYTFYIHMYLHMYTRE